MERFEVVREFLDEVNVNKSLQTDNCCCALLALIDAINTGKNWMSVRDMYLYTEEYKNSAITRNSFEIFRKQVRVMLKEAIFVIDNGRESRSPSQKFRIAEGMLDTIASRNKAYM